MPLLLHNIALLVESRLYRLHDLLNRMPLLVESRLCKLHVLALLLYNKALLVECRLYRLYGLPLLLYRMHLLVEGRLRKLHGMCLMLSRRRLLIERRLCRLYSLHLILYIRPLLSPLQNLVAELHHNRRMLLLTVSELMNVVVLRPSYHVVTWVSIGSLEGSMHPPEDSFGIALPWAHLLDVQTKKDLK